MNTANVVFGASALCPRGEEDTRALTPASADEDARRALESDTARGGCRKGSGPGCCSSTTYVLRDEAVNWRKKQGDG